MFRCNRKILFWVLLLGGVGFVIGGIFIHPLLVPGGALIAAAAALQVVLSPSPEQSQASSHRTERPISNEVELIVHTDEIEDVDLEFSVHVGHHAYKPEEEAVDVTTPPRYKN